MAPPSGSPTLPSRPPTARSTSATPAPGSASTSGSSPTSSPAPPRGRLLKYDPRTGEASVALDNLAFANGVALSRDEAFVVVCESGGFRCSRLWLKGDKAGQADTFVQDLPGCPDNIRLASNGSFWIAIHPLRSPLIDLVTRWTMTKRIVASFPALLDRIMATAKGAMVVQVSENGDIIRVLDDSEGKVINFITSVTEFDGDLFFGSLSTKSPTL